MCIVTQLKKRRYQTNHNILMEERGGRKFLICDFFVALVGEEQKEDQGFMENRTDFKMDVYFGIVSHLQGIM